MKELKYNTNMHWAFIYDQLNIEHYANISSYVNLDCFKISLIPLDLVHFLDKRYL